MSPSSRSEVPPKIVRGRSPGGRHRDDSGAALVEFALILPVFALMLFGMIQFGLAFTGWDQLRNAVQTGARMAAMDDLGSNTTGCTPPPSLNANMQTLICEIQDVIGTPPGTSGSPAIALYFAPNAGGPPTEVVVCAREQAQVFTGFFPAMHLTATSEFYIDRLDPQYEDYNPAGLEPSTCG